MASKIKADAKDFESQRKMVVDLLSAAENGDVEQFKKTIDAVKLKSKASSVEVVLTEFKDGNKRTALHFAAAKGRRKVVTYILDLVPALLNIQDEDGSTPLLLAARENEFSTVRLLLDRGADPHITQKSGVAAIHEAAGNGSLRTLKLLREQGVSLDAESKNGTPLHYAVNEGREKTVDELVSLGANANVKTPKGVSPLILGCMLNKPTIAKTLLVAGKADLSAALPGGITALHIAAEAGFLEIAKLLLTTRREETVVLANMTFDGGATPLQLAAGKGHAQIVALLQPITKGYETTKVDELMAQEKQKMDAYLAEATKQAAAVHEETTKEEETEDDKQKKLILEGVTPENDIVVPETKPLDDETIAKALALKEDGNKAFAAKDFTTAIECYTKAIAVSAADAVLYSNRCAAYLGANEPKKALNDVRLAKKLKPQWVKALFREGQCLEKLGLFEDAAVCMWEAIQLQPKDKALEKRFQEVVAKGRAQQQQKKKDMDAAAANDKA